ncbi:MAG: type II toxin-antitoxin system PemK/MazF family toxin [Parcubacteria group bacterium]|nr:type II toxin-antitoxin system PemK/MazF family toxin [Parcubacteria group bacterium]
MEIPIKIRIPLCIEQGSVLNFFIDFGSPNRQSKNRYFVVLNSNPKTDTVLIMVTCTTQVQKKKEFVRASGISQETIVEIKSKSYAVLTKDSVFDCNNVFEVKTEELIKKIEQGGSMDYPKLPSNILKRIVVGVNKSPKVSQAIKDFM